MAELKTPIFDKNGMFNRQGRKMRAVMVMEIADGGDLFRLWRHDGAPENGFPADENDEYYIHVEAAGYLIPLGWTLSGIAKRLGWPDMVAELYGSEEARAEHFERLRGVLSDSEICGEFNRETTRAVEVGMNSERIAAFVRREFDRHKAAYQQAVEDGGQSWPDYIGAVLCGKLEAVPALRAHYDELRAQKERERQAQREAEAAARMAAQDQEAREVLERAAQTIRQGGTLANKEITDGSGIVRPVVLRLMDVYGVAVPPRTRAWMRDKLAAVTFAPGGRVSGLQYRRTRGGRCSGAVCDYLARLVEAVRAKSGEGAA